ncbi:MAG: hypothetical protein WCM76_05000 [Bacteroidota bacterium]
MAHHEENLHLSPEEIKFNDFVKRGDDFYRIELYQYAVVWYKKALECNIDTENIRQKIADSESKFRRDGKKIIIAATSVAIVIAAVACIIKFWVM